MPKRTKTKIDKITYNIGHIFKKFFLLKKIKKLDNISLFSFRYIVYWIIFIDDLTGSNI